MPLVVQYHGRVCLLGEHCDWAGGSSLTVPLPMNIRLAVEDCPQQDHIRMRTAVHGELQEWTWPLAGAVDPDGGVQRFGPACTHALHARGIPVRPSTLWVHGSLPAGRGFSSSAAFTLAVLDGLSRHAGHPLPAEDLADLAYTVEHDILGVACGRLDPLACAAGAPVFLAWGADGRAPLRRIHLGQPVHLVVGAFPRPRDTRAILDALQRHHAGSLGEATQAVHGAVETFASEAEAGAHALANGDLAGLGASMWRCQEAYDAVASAIPELHAPQLSRVCTALHARGALGAKFSGAGGDGSIVVLARDQPESVALAALLHDAGLSVWRVPVLQS